MFFIASLVDTNQFDYMPPNLRTTVGGMMPNEGPWSIRRLLDAFHQAIVLSNYVSVSSLLIYVKYH
jgi:hypothetical protein